MALFHHEVGSRGKYIDFFATVRSALFAAKLFRTILNMSICPDKNFEASEIVIACAEIFAIQVNSLV